MCSKGSGRNIIPFFYALKNQICAQWRCSIMFGSTSDAVGPGLNLFGSANHYSTGRSPATGSSQEKNILKKIK
jgi:hypothetical protein